MIKKAKKGSKKNKIFSAANETNNALFHLYRLFLYMDVIRAGKQRYAFY